MAKNSPSSLIITIIIAMLALGIGLVVGYLLRPVPAQGGTNKKYVGFGESLDNIGSVHLDSDKSAALEMLHDCGQLAREDPVISKHLVASDMEACRALTCDIPYPRTYVVHKLIDDAIDLDGRLDERAWTRVGWTDTFVDIQGQGFEVPHLQTKVKMRYDNTFLFLGLHLEETDVWANVTLHDGPVYQDNSIQILIDTRQSNINYKEISVNARGTISDSMMTKPYIDSGEPLSFWESDAISAVHVEGTLNRARASDKFWTIEMAIPFTSLYQGAGASINYTSPKHGDTWRANFMRVQWPVERQGRSYVKKQGASTNFWVWQSPKVVNVHLPERWGLIQFQDTEVNQTRFETSDKWITTNALLDTYSALRAFHAVTGRYTDRKELLNLPPYIVSGKCLKNLVIQLDWTGFKVTVEPLNGASEKGHTRTDHFVWYGKEDMQYF